MLRRIWPALLLLLTPAATCALPASLPVLPSTTLSQRDRWLLPHASRDSKFVNVGHYQHEACEDLQPPEALATPDPLPLPDAQGKNVKVSFIIGTDGRVHSPLILESAGMAGDRRVLETVRTWRYRPATCDGIPTETEGKIEFSSR
jgi:TonB family protein